MSDRLSLVIKLIVLPGLLLGLPFLGLILSGPPLGPYLEFPPQTQTVSHAPFSWTMFWLFSLIEIGIVIGLLYVLRRGTGPSEKPRDGSTKHSYPWWGWIGIGSLGLFWVLAWTRFPWFAEFQALTFTPLWLSFIVALNALTYQRTGQCLLLNRPRFFGSLFIWSALFWWYFEYLNRFVQNWRYIGVEPLTPTFYVLHSTLAFSTVLPAVISMSELFRSFSLFNVHHVQQSVVLTNPKRFAWTLVLTGSVGLLGLAQWPDYVFAFLWVSPLLLLLAFQLLRGEDRFFSALAQGKWGVVTLPACAALCCGLFWELWNFYSQAKWVYSIPFIDRFHVFEMPILGYAGYVPFGLECMAAVHFFFPDYDLEDIK